MNTETNIPEFVVAANCFSCEKILNNYELKKNSIFCVGCAKEAVRQIRARRHSTDTKNLSSAIAEAAPELLEGCKAGKAICDAQGIG